MRNTIQPVSDFFIVIEAKLCLTFMIHLNKRCFIGTSKDCLRIQQVLNNIRRRKKERQNQKQTITPRIW